MEITRTTADLLSALERAEERLRLALEASGAGIWDWDMTNGTLLWDDGMHRLFGTRKSEWRNHYSGFAESLEPDDLAECERIIAEAVACRTPYRYRFRLRKGGVIYGLGKVYYGDAGEPLRMVGICIEYQKT